MANNELYPGFSGNILRNRLQRLETGSQRLQGNQFRPTAGQYARIPIDILDQDSALTLTSSTIKKKGGVSVSGNRSGFAYTSTDSSITWYWDGTNGSTVIVITRADGSKFTVPSSGSGLTVTGLSASTTYYFLPFWDVNNLCNIGWVQGTIGAPQIAFVAADTTDVVNGNTYLLLQTSQTREALTGGWMSAATAAGGGSGGGGGGGGGAGGHCVMSGSIIQPLGCLHYEAKVKGNFEWIHLRTNGGKDLHCTWDHPLYHAENGKVLADTLALGDIVITDAGEEEIIWNARVKRKCSLWEITMEKGHLYWANGFLSHNKVAQNL